MPYITPILRGQMEMALRPILFVVGKLNPFEGTGRLNYIITRLVLRFIGPTPGYANYNAAIGVLEAVKLELYRRMVAPYEDGKRAANGDVFPAQEQEVRDAASRCQCENSDVL